MCLALSSMNLKNGKHIQGIKKLHLRSLRKIMNMKWEDKVSSPATW